MAPLTLRRRLSREAISHSVISSASFEKSSLNIILGSRGDQSSRPPFKRPRLWLSLLQEFPEGIEQDETWNRSHQENAGLGKQFSPGPFRQQFRLCEEVQYISNQLNNEITEPDKRNLICRFPQGIIGGHGLQADKNKKNFQWIDTEINPAQHVHYPAQGENQ
ncbi:MAG: hypothetical protein WBN83_13640 [Desulfoprunum sp.]|jgi:hypothetical protein